MSIVDVRGLLKDIQVVFVLPSVCFVMALINIRLSSPSKFSLLKFRLSLSFVLLLFVCALSVLMFQDRGMLMAIWRTSPVEYTFVYSGCSFTIITAVAFLIYWKLRPELWRKK